MIKCLLEVVLGTFDSTRGRHKLTLNVVYEEAKLLRYKGGDHLMY